MGSLRTLGSDKPDYVSGYLFPQYKITKTVVRKARNLVEIVTANMNAGIGRHPSDGITYMHLFESEVEPGVLAIATSKLFSLNIFCAVMSFEGKQRVFLTRKVDLEQSFDNMLWEILPPDTPRITREMLLEGTYGQS